MRLSPVPILLLLARAGPAGAVVADDVKITIDGVTDVDAIGIDDCAGELTESREAKVEISGTLPAEYDVRIVWSIGEGTTCSTDLIEDCIDRSEDGKCGCLKGVSNTSSVSSTFTLSELDATLCATSTRVSVRGHYLADDVAETDAGTSDSDGEQISGDAVTFEIDLSPPERPASAPTVVPRDSAIEVSAESVNDATSYEVCYRPRSAASPDAGADESGTTTEARRSPYTDNDCEELTTLTSYRIDGLENNLTYDVVYAAFDSAGNRSPNSNTSGATPSDVLDFAEYYSGRWNGGEKGGCSATFAHAAHPLVLLGAGGVAALGLRLRLRRRNR